MHFNPTFLLRFGLQFFLGRLSDLSFDNFSLYALICLVPGLVFSEAACWDVVQQIGEEIAENILKTHCPLYNRCMAQLASCVQTILSRCKTGSC